jgi:hypothetical protein
MLRSKSQLPAVQSTSWLHAAQFCRLALLLAAASPALLGAHPAQDTQQTPALRRLVQFRNAAPEVGYVGSKACAECHVDIYQTYMKTDMSRAMSLPSKLKELPGLDHPVTVKHPKANRYYQVYRRGTDFYQSEYELDATGKEVWRDEQKISYIMGSGANGFTCLVTRGDFLFEAPLSYFSKTRKWDLSPGYEQSDLSFSRPIEGDCIFCHSGRPQPAAESGGRFKNPPFLELTIGCEMCHGPGALHVQERLRTAPLHGDIDTSIVNPSKIPGWLSDNICMFCHQGLDARALMPGKTYADFRPGVPLAETLAIFVLPIRRGEPPGDPLLQNFVPKNLSQCYRKSGGKLNCITCHDPHVQPTPPQTPAYFRSKCMNCHTEKNCTLPLAARLAKTPPNDCAGCHMPKQNLTGISHSSVTDHRIPARPGEPLPEEAYHLTTPELPDLVFVDPEPSAEPTQLPPVTLFRAYSQLVQLNGEYAAAFDSTLDALAKAGTQDPAVLTMMALKLMSADSPQAQAAAPEYFERAIAAGSIDPQNFELVATFQVQSGRTQDAIATVQHGLELNPYSPRLYRMLAALCISVKSYDKAIETMKKGLELFPEDSFLRSLMQKTESAKAQESNGRQDPF